MDKWKVQLLGCSVEEWTTQKDSDYNDVKWAELSVVHKSFKHGQQSLGWSGLKKIILPELISFSLKSRQKQFAQATAICEALNNANL